MYIRKYMLTQIYNAMYITKYICTYCMYSGASFTCTPWDWGWFVTLNYAQFWPYVHTYVHWYNWWSLCIKHPKHYYCIAQNFNFWRTKLADVFGWWYTDNTYNYVTRYEKTRLMCTKYTHSYYCKYLHYCVRLRYVRTYSQSVSCMRL